MKPLIFALLMILTSCAGGSGVNFNDGNWAMCKTTDENGVMIANLPYPLGGLPPGAGATVDGITTICTPIPKQE